MGKKGQIFPDRRRKYKDSRTGRTVWQMTNTPGGTSHAQYFTQPATTPDGQWLIYGSDQGRPPGRLNIFKMDLHTGVSVQLTDSDKNLKPRWSHLSPDGKEVYFIEDTAHVKAVNVDTLEERSIHRVDHCFRAHQLSVSPDNRFLVDGFFLEDKKEDDFLVGQGLLIRSAVIVIDTKSGLARRLLDGNAPRTHAQYCPTNAELLFYCYGGPWWRVQRLWLIHADGTGNHPIFKQTNFEGAGHEFWSQDGKTIYITCNGGRQPQGLWAMDVANSNEWCVLAGACVGHGAANGEQDRFVIDELFNDCKTGLWVSKKGSPEPQLLCQTRADWAGKAQEYHPHPRFLPDGKTVSFTSAMTGSCEVYLVEI
jgi:Tol biopolymer transport system component